MKYYLSVLLGLLIFAACSTGGSKDSSSVSKDTIEARIDTYSKDVAALETLTQIVVVNGDMHDVFTDYQMWQDALRIDRQWLDDHAKHLSPEQDSLVKTLSEREDISYRIINDSINTFNARLESN
jgi:hypothetical protein